MTGIHVNLNRPGEADPEVIADQLSDKLYDGEVLNYADLPATPTTGETYYVQVPTGTKWNPLSTYRDAGFYRWDGSAWEYRGNTSDEIELQLAALKAELGWIQFSDPSASVRNIAANTRTKITFDASPSVLNTNGPSDAATWWNQTNGVFQPNNSGDAYILRPSFICDPTLNNRNLTLELDIGGTQGVIWSRTIRLARGAGVDTKVTETMPIYTLGTFVANGGEFYITCDGDMTYTDLVMMFQRTFRA